MSSHKEGGTDVGDQDENETY